MSPEKDRKQKEAHLFLQLRLHRKVIHMQTALRLLLLPCPSARPLRLITLTTHRDSTVPVSDALVAFIEELIPWDFV